MAKREEIKCRIFVGDRPIEELTDKEREEFSARCARRMGDSLNSWFGLHPDEYEKVVGSA